MARKGIQVVYWQDGKRRTYPRTFTTKFRAVTQAKAIRDWFGVESVEVIDWAFGGLLAIFEK